MTHRATGSGFLVKELVSRGPGHDVPPHTHEHPHVCFVASGRFEIGRGNQVEVCPPHTILFHPAGTTHRDRLVSNRGACVVLSLRAAPGSGVREAHDFAGFIAVPDVETGFVGHRLRMELRAPDGLSPVAVEALVWELIAHHDSRGHERGGAAPAWLPRAMDFIRDHAASGTRVRDVALAVAVHPVHLARVFRAHLGVSPVEYLRRVRIQTALERIERTQDPLSWVAMAAGFCDQSEMTKAFRRELGRTPGDWRLSMRT